MTLGKVHSKNLGSGFTAIGVATKTVFIAVALVLLPPAIKGQEIFEQTVPI